MQERLGLNETNNQQIKEESKSDSNNNPQNSKGSKNCNLH